MSDQPGAKFAPPPPDPPRTPPDPAKVADLAGRLAALRDRLAADEPSPDDGLTPLGSLGRWVLLCLGLTWTDVAPPGLPAADRERLYREVGRRFAGHVLPAPAELAGLDAAAVEAYLAALAADRADAGRLAGAFGDARLSAFGSDRRLTYRVGGYLGRPGFPLADHLIDAVVRPAAAAVAPG